MAKRPLNVKNNINLPVEENLMIIDAHTHLGDILYAGGGQLIYRKGIRKKAGFDLISLSEKALYRTNVVFEWILNTFFSDMIDRKSVV